MIPESKQDAVEKALSETLAVNAPDEITVLTGGLSTALVCRIRVHGTDYVLRINFRTSHFNDPAREFSTMRAAAAAAVAPEVFYTNATDGISITRFIERKSPVGFPVLTDLVQRIKTIHSLPLFPKVTNCLDGVDEFIRQFQETHILPPEATKEHFALYSQIQRAYPRHDPDLVSSHNDLNPNNILFDGARLWIVDWEAAFANDRYADLANVANSFISTNEAEEHFLRDYFGDELNAYHRARFFLMRQVSHFCFGSVFFRMAAGIKPPGVTADPDMSTPGLGDFYGMFTKGQISLDSFEGKLLYAKVLFNESLRMMKTPRFSESIARMQRR